MGMLTVLYDACVLYPAPLRDFLMHLALTDLFAARWTDRIHEEWIRALLGKRPDLTREQLERTRELMNAHVRDCLVTEYETLIESLHLLDPAPGPGPHRGETSARQPEKSAEDRCGVSRHPVRTSLARDSISVAGLRRPDLIHVRTFLSLPLGVGQTNS